MVCEIFIFDDLFHIGNWKHLALNSVQLEWKTRSTSHQNPILFSMCLISEGVIVF